jgi:small conductance mechanosensitive channel
VSRSEDLDRVRGLLDEVGEEIFNDQTVQGSLLSRPTVLGVEEVRANAAVFRMVADTRSSRRFDIQRELRHRIQSRLEQEGVELPSAFEDVLASQDGNS